MKKVVFFVITILLVSLAATMVLGETKPRNTRVYYESVLISKGDTLWNIAEEYKVDGVRTKTYVKEIMELNHIKNENIVSGQKILVPVTEGEQVFLGI